MWDLISLGIMLGRCPLQPVQSPVVREPRAVRDCVGNSQGRQDAMKPHIRLAGVTAVRGMWLCLNRTDTGRVVHYKAGLGKSPTEAYADWARVNDVNQNS